jgi:hypothetical protein
MQVASLMRDHLEKGGSWQAVHRMHRHANCARRDATVRRLFKPRERSSESALTIEDALGYRFKNKSIMETAITHSCVSTCGHSLHCASFSLLPFCGH